MGFFFSLCNIKSLFGTHGSKTASRSRAPRGDRNVFSKDRCVNNEDIWGFYAKGSGLLVGMQNCKFKDRNRVTKGQVWEVKMSHKRIITSKFKPKPLSNPLQVCSVLAVVSQLWFAEAQPGLSFNSIFSALLSPSLLATWRWNGLAQSVLNQHSIEELS